MKIAVDISMFRNGNSGVFVYIASLLDALQKIDTENSYFLFERYPSNYRVRNPKWKKVVLPFPKFPGSQSIWFHIVFPASLRKYHIAVLWAPAFFLPLLVPKTIAAFLTVHDLTYIRHPATMDQRHLRMMRIFAPISIRRADRIFTNSNFVKRELLTCYPDRKDAKISVIECGKRCWRLPQDYRWQNRRDYLFFTGNFEPRKNLLNIFRALEECAAHRLQIQLQIAGPDGWGNDAMKAYLASSPIRDNIVFLGYIGEDLLLHKYCECKALLFPSLYEGFGMPVIEALQLDCLVITSQNSVMQEICGEAALYCNPLDPLDMARMIRTIYQPGFERTVFLSDRDKILGRYEWEKSAAAMKKEMTAPRL